VTAGPYAFVRHPMYLGVPPVGLGTRPGLQSWYAGLVPVPVVAACVRWRMVPGLF